MLTEPDVYEVHNLNRQHVYLSDVGLSKAAVLAGRARAINPYAEVSIDDRGVVADNVASLVGSAALIIDGVDVTARGPWRASTRSTRSAELRSGCVFAVAIG